MKAKKILAIASAAGGAILAAGGLVLSRFSGKLEAEDEDKDLMKLEPLGGEDAEEIEAEEIETEEKEDNEEKKDENDE